MILCQMSKPLKYAQSMLYKQSLMQLMVRKYLESLSLYVPQIKVLCN